MKLSKNFDDKEFVCKCCGKLPLTGMSVDLITRLQILRDLVKKPIHINSGHRCKLYNAKVGGATNSQHMKGTAADITIEGLTPEKVAFLAHMLEFNGIGLYDTFTHVDVRPQKARWDERVKNKHRAIVFEL